MLKRNPLNIQKRLEILQDLESGLSVNTIAAKHNVTRASICRARNCAARILKFVQYGNEMKKGKRIRGSMYEEIENRLYTWFSERKTQGAQLSNPLLLKKATEISKECGAFPKFKASPGWLKKFKIRHNIYLAPKRPQQRIRESRNRIIPWEDTSDKKKCEDGGKEDDRAGEGVQVESEIDENRNRIIPWEDISDKEMDEDEEKEDDRAGEGVQVESEIVIEEEIDVKEEKVELNCYYHEEQVEQQNENAEEIDVKEETVELCSYNYHGEQLELKNENDRRELSDLFERLASHSAKAPPYIQMMITGVKMFFLPEK